MEISLSLSLTGRLLSSSLATALFSVAGSRGFFYDFSDYTTQFTDTAGTTAITGVGQSLGLVLDKSAGLALGPELVTNGDFSSATGWTLQAGWSISGGTLNGNVAPAVFTNAFASVSLVAGRTYQVTYTITSLTSGSVRVAFFSGTGVSGAVRSSIGTYTEFLVAASGNLSAGFQGQGAGFVGIIDNVSVRELAGNHATQATAGSRALTQVRPMFTQRNRAVGSELPESATYWPASATQNGITATKVASGFRDDGLPYVRVRYQGTSTATFQNMAYFSQSSRTPAISGQTLTASLAVSMVAGSVPTNGKIQIYVTELNSVGGSLVQSFSDVTPSGTESVISHTRTLNNASTAQASCTINLAFSSGVAVDITLEFAGLQFEFGSARTTYQPAVSGELRNRAIGSGAVDNATYWPASVVNNGITATKVASGTDTDGLPYVDVRYTGTATDTFHGIAYADQFSRGPATVGQSWTASLTARVLSGSLTNVNGIDARTVEETAPFTFVGQTIGNQVTASVDTRSVSTRVIASGNQVRLAIVLNVTNGATIDITYRIKGLQLEQASTYSRYQRVITANEWYEPGFTSYRGIRFDGSDDFLQTAAIDFAGAESLGPELVTNGTFASNITGWSDTSDAGGSIAWNPLGYLDLINTTGTARTQQDLAVTAGHTYKFVVSNPGANTVNVYVGSTSGGINLLATTLTAGQTGTYILTATSSILSLGFRNFGAGTTDSIDNVSVKEVLISADKMTVVAGVRKLSDAAQGIIVELTTSAGVNAGSFNLQGPGVSPAQYRAVSGGSGIGAGNASVSAGYAAPVSNVFSVQSDISGDSVNLRLNGILASTSAGDQGTGNYSTAPIYIGRRGGTSLPFNGIITFLCVINRTLTASELAQLETFANSRTGAY